jgi:peptide/nickel transport system substrate-binding protein
MLGMKRRRAGRFARLALVVVVAALAVVIGGCGGSSSSGGGGGSSGGSGELRIGTLDQFQNPNYFNVFHVVDYDVLDLEYPLLVQYNSAGKVVPGLASSWSHSPDGKEWTFHLRSGVKWSDGQPMTSADVAFTYNTIIKYKNGAASVWSQDVAGMTKVTTPNPTTAVIHYSAPVAAALSFINNAPILPEHVWKKYASGKLGANLKTFKNTFPSVSGGPFIPTSFNGTTFVSFKANPNWYGPKPAVSELGLEYFTTPDSILQALKTNQIDYATGLPQSSLKTIQSYPNVTVNSYPAINYLGLYINAAPAAPHPELSNPLVRQAIDVSLDRKAMVDTEYPGSSPGESIVPPAVSGWWNPAVKPVYDPTLANKLLDQAGFKEGANGIRVADGHPMSYTVDLDNVQLAGVGDRIFQIIQRNLKAIGINVTVKPLDPDAWLAAVFGKNTTYNQFDMALETDAALLDPGFDLIYNTCGNRGAYNWSGFCNKQYDALYAKQSAELNAAKRKQIVFQMQKFGQKTVPVSVLLYTNTVDAHQNDFTGFGASPNGSLNYFGVTQFTTIHKK